ncbi:hypothetical protein [Cellulomonas massiliensis]|uniref:hypothetical protein n=1 Tax=Cellulomonas massiliensis TaxID=1465811 RepID=UPI00031B9EC6|nr:hypothetical protein [Cellulomonas massiliensis]
MTDDPEVVRVRGRVLDLERLTYATIVVMSVLAVYQGWQELNLLEAALVVTAPVIAMAAAHFYSEILHEHALVRRPLTRSEWRHAAVHQAQLLLAAVPPLVVLVLARLTERSTGDVQRAVLVTGTVTLVALASVAGRHAGFRGRQLVVVCLAGGLVGLLVISLQVLLKPH